MAATPGSTGIDSVDPTNSTTPSIHEVFPTPPFDEDPKADFILESAEGHRFRVVKAILIHASPVFETLLSLPQPPVVAVSSSNDHWEQQLDGGLPVVKVTESSRTLDTLLRICYPITSPHLDDLTEIDHVLEAALKYELEVAISELRKALQAPKFRDPSNALVVFVIACRNKLGDDARRAALDTLKGPFIPKFNPALAHISAATYFHLQQYHIDASAVVSSMFTGEFLDIYPQDVHDIIVCSYNRCPDRRTTQDSCCATHNWRTRTAWWTRFRDRSNDIVKGIPLSDEVFTIGFIVQLISTAACSTCLPLVLSKWPAITDALKTERDRLLSEVQIDLSGAGL
ncbi:hypothetical protein BD410DRAFT_532428 [Rickenella mellea]|uniref:BTB domain-containing protein n=1 Tax=Rickenella mellea TaxID=50990 RepID=A0A4Y7QHM2_9AGAM|nr:hypothetical protein BD410DRAFT_532428 [Rickenella mellea]